MNLSDAVGKVLDNKWRTTKDIHREVMYRYRHELVTLPNLTHTYNVLRSGQAGEVDYYNDGLVIFWRLKG